MIATAIETPSQRRAKQLKNALATAQNIVAELAAADRENSLRPLKQDVRAKVRKHVETHQRTLGSLMEGFLQ